LYLRFEMNLKYQQRLLTYPKYHLNLKLLKFVNYLKYRL
jgi:hypothetical protein